MLSAQVIRRLRDLGMPLDSIRSVLTAPDLEARNREIAAHLARMERQLEQTQASVAGLRALLEGPAVRPAVELRRIPAVTALASSRRCPPPTSDWGTTRSVPSRTRWRAGVARPGRGTVRRAVPRRLLRAGARRADGVRPCRPPPGGFAVAGLPRPGPAARDPGGGSGGRRARGPARRHRPHLRRARHRGSRARHRRRRPDPGVLPDRLPGNRGESKHRTEVCWPVFLTG